MSALPVLYSFRRCPYAMRARLALAVSGQVCELREVVLRNKPHGLLQASPKATVPVLVLHLSTDTAPARPIYVEQHFPAGHEAQCAAAARADGPASAPPGWR